MSRQLICRVECGAVQFGILILFVISLFYKVHGTKVLLAKLPYKCIILPILGFR